MTRHDFQLYINQLAPKLRLGHWMIEVSDEKPTNPDAWASVVFWKSRFAATIRLSDNILNESPENQRYTAVHELVHCHLAQHDQLVGEALRPADLEACATAMEYAVDALAQTIAPHMPYPRQSKWSLRLRDIPDYFWEEA